MNDNHNETAEQKPPAIEWNLHLRMAKRGIRTAVKLAELLHGVGIDISTAHASRLVNAPPQRLSMDILAGLLEVLDCGPGDLMGRGRHPDREDAGSPTERQVRPPNKKPVKTEKKTLPVNVGKESSDPADIARRLGMPLATSLPNPWSKKEK